MPYGINEELIPTLNSLGNFEGYDQDFWSCHERALWGIAHLRYYHPGCRTALALGTRLVPKDEAHSLIVLWDGSTDVWAYYDPEMGLHKEEYFEATKVVPFPPPSQSKNSEAIPGFEQFSKRSNSFLILNPTYDTSEGDKVKSYLNKLRNKIDDFKTPQNVNDSVFKSKYVVHDRVLLECMKIRNRFRKFPIGVAYGMITMSIEQGKEPTKMEYSVLALWEKPNASPKYWGLRRGDLSGIEFVPSVVIV